MASEEQLPLHQITIHLLIDSRTAAAVAERVARVAGLGRVGCGSVAIATLELATNMVRHAGGGVIDVHVLERGVMVVARDDGPGISDLDVARLDRHSRGRRLTPDDPRSDGLGCGLGAVQRLMDRVEIDTGPGRGTTIRAAKFVREGR